MSTIINAFTNQALFDDVSLSVINNNGSNSGLYNIISRGFQHNYNNPVHGGGAVSDDVISTQASNSPSLQNLSPELNDLSINRLKFIVLGIIGSVLTVLGLMGNTMSMVVLQQRQMRSSTSYYLLSLAIYDNLILLSMLLYFIIPSLATNVPFMKDYLAGYSVTEPIGYPLSLTAQMGSIYTCVGFTVERFIAVCRPLQVANTCTKSRTIRAIILIFVWSVLYNIPRFFHLQAVYFNQDSTSPGTPGVSEDSLLTTSSQTYDSHIYSHIIRNSLQPHHHHQNVSFSLHSQPFLQTTPPGMPCVRTAMPNIDFSQGLKLPCHPSKSIDRITSSLSELVENLPTASFAFDNTNSNDITFTLAPPLSSSSSSNSSLILSILLPSSSSSSSSLSSSTPSVHYSSHQKVSSNPSTATTTSAAFSASFRPTTTAYSSGGRPGVKYVKAQPTSFGSDPLFRNIYLIYSQLFFMFLLPFLIILFMNIGLIRAVRRSKAMHQRMGTSASAKKERNLTVMLIAVIVVFLVCQFPTIIDNILVAVFGTPKLYPSYQYQCFYTACTLMVLVNSASNFLLYCFFGKKFRVVFFSLMGIKKRQQYVAYRSTMYRSRSNGSRGCDIELSVV